MKNRTLNCPNCKTPFSVEGVESRAPSIACPKCNRTVKLLDADTVSSDPVPDNEELLRNIKIDGCEIIKVLGQGGMGIVVEARQTYMGDRTVAIKILSPQLASKSSYVKRFEVEGTALSNLSHANIVTIHDRGQTDDGHMYFIMEYVAGLEGGKPTDLGAVMKKERLSPKDVKHYALQICNALDYAHEQGIIHRDIKPGNVLVGRGKHAKVADFGIAFFSSQNQTRLTNSLSSMGTPDYCSPEQRRDAANVSHLTDVYSLGILLYEMLTGNIPTPNYKLPSAVVEGLDPKWDTLVNDALQYDPAERLAGMVEFKNRLDEIFTDGQAPTQPAETSHQCPDCDTTVSADAKYCPKCRTQQWLECENCSCKLHASVDFCPECGTGLQKQKRYLQLLSITENGLRHAQDKSLQANDRCEHASKAAGAAKRLLIISSSDKRAQELLDNANGILISTALHAGDDAYRQKNLSESLHFMEYVLEVEPKHPFASKRCEKINEFFQQSLSQADGMLAKGSPSQAASVLEKLTVMFPGNKVVKAKLESCREAVRLSASLVERLKATANKGDWWQVKTILEVEGNGVLQGSELNELVLNMRKRVQNSQALVNTAISAAKQGKVMEARAYAERALTFVPDHPQALELLGRASQNITESTEHWSKIEQACRDRRWFVADALFQNLPEKLASPTGRPIAFSQLRNSSLEGVHAANRFMKLLFWSLLGGVALYFLDTLSKLFVDGMFKDAAEASPSSSADLGYLGFFTLGICVTAFLLRSAMSANPTRSRFVVSIIIGACSIAVIIAGRLWLEDTASLIGLEDIAAWSGLKESELLAVVYWCFNCMSLALPLGIVFSLMSSNLFNPPVRSFAGLLFTLVITFAIVAIHCTVKQGLMSFNVASTCFLVPSIWLFSWMQIRRLSTGWWRTSLVIFAGWLASIIAMGIERGDLADVVGLSVSDLRLYTGLSMLFIAGWLVQNRKALISSIRLAAIVLVAVKAVPWLEDHFDFALSDSDEYSLPNWGRNSFLLTEAALTLWWMSAAYIAHSSREVIDARWHLLDRLSWGANAKPKRAGL